MYVYETLYPEKVICVRDLASSPGLGNKDHILLSLGTRSCITSSPGHSQILSRSRGEKLGEGLVPLLRHGPEMVDSVLT